MEKKIRAPCINVAQFNFLYLEKNGLSVMVTCAWREWNNKAEGMEKQIYPM